MTIPASIDIGRLRVESCHRPAANGAGGDIHDVMATPFGIRLLIGDVMGTGLSANRTGLSVRFFLFLRPGGRRLEES